MEVLHSTVLEWIERLGLGDQYFRIEFDDPNNSKIDHSTVVWNGNVWVVQYKKPSKYVIIHELGHVYIRKLLKSIQYTKQQIRTKELTPIEKELHVIINELEDRFVDYNLSNFQEYYHIFSNEIKTLVVGAKILPVLSLSYSLIFYIRFFLLLNCFLSDEGRRDDVLSKWLEFNLKALRTIIIDNYKKREKKFTYEKFCKLDAKLLEFERLKDLSSLIGERSRVKILIKNCKIVQFFYSVVKCLGLFNDNLLKNFLFNDYGIRPN